MKQVLKIILGALIGACIGFIIVAFCVFVFTDTSAVDFFDKFISLNFLEILGISLISLLSFCLALFLQIILHEGGHLLFGLATGYRFVSFRILSLTFIREEGNFRVKRFNIAGTGGQCLLSPPNGVYEQVPYFFYNAGGVLMNLLISIIALFIWILSETTFIDMFLLHFFICGFFLTILNGIPMKVGGIANDAYNIVLMRQDLFSRKYFAQQLTINAEIQKGIRLRDIPADCFSMDEDINYNNPLQVALYIASISRYMDFLDFETASICFKDLLQHSAEIPDLFVKEITCELLFLELVGTCRKEEIEKLYTVDIQKYIQQYKQVMSSKQRLLCALALCWENDCVKAQKIYEYLFRNRQKYLLQGEVTSDLELMKYLLTNKSFQ